MSKHLTCCGEPSLGLLKTLHDKSHDSESVRQCASCGAYWFHRDTVIP